MTAPAEAPTSAYVPVAEADVTAAYKTAMRYAGRKAAEYPAASEVIHDRATDAVLFARSHCWDASTFPAFAQSVLTTFVRRAIGHSARSAAGRPEHVSIDAAREGDDGELEGTVAVVGDAAVAPLLHPDLPDELAFILRLYFLDGYDLRDTALLTGLTPNQVMRRLRQAADILEPDRAKPIHTADHKRFTRG